MPIMVSYQIILEKIHGLIKVLFDNSDNSEWK